MAACLLPVTYGACIQSLRHVVADALWSDETVLDSPLPAMLRQGLVVDDTGFDVSIAAKPANRITAV